MALVNIPPRPGSGQTPRPGSGQAAEQVTLRDRAEVTAFLAGHGIEYERWTPAHPVAPDAPADALLAAYAGQTVVCLAGPDAAYDEWGAEAATALRDAGAMRVILAGRPRGFEVDDSCAVGVDAVAFLRRTREALA